MASKVQTESNTLLSRRSGGSRGSETSSRFVSDRVMLPLTPASVHAVLIERLCAVAELTHYSTRQCILTFFHPLAGKRDHNVGGAGAHCRQDGKSGRWSTSRRRRRRYRARRWPTCYRRARQPTPATTPCPHTAGRRPARRHAHSRRSAACCVARSSQSPRQAGRSSCASGPRQWRRRRASGASVDQSVECDVLLARAMLRGGAGADVWHWALVACECVSVGSYIRILSVATAPGVTRRVQGRRAAGVRSRNFARNKKS